MSTPLEHILFRSFKAEAISYIKGHPEDFQELVNYAISDQAHVNWRAAWLITNCMQDNDPRLGGYVDKIVSELSTKQDNHQRELLKILLRMRLKEEQESYLFDHAVRLWESLKKAPAVRYIAFRMMAEIATKYPELKNEVLMLTQPQYLTTLSPGVQHSVKKLIKQLEH